MKEKRLGFMGLGSIGFPMCHGLFKSGYALVLPTYRREIDQRYGFSTLTPDTASKTAAIDEMLSHGAQSAASMEDFVQKSDVILISMPTSKQVEELVLAPDGILANCKQGGYVVDLTSADPASIRRLSALLREKGVGMLDACVSGGISGAIAQTLTIMVGGEEADYMACRPVLETIGAPEKVRYVGPSGAGNTIKVCNNFLSACCTAANTEALMVAVKAGIEPKLANEIIGTSGGKSDASINKFPNLVFSGKDFSFTLNLMTKDVGLFNTVAKEMHIPTFLSNVVYQLWSLCALEGDGNDDCLNFIRMYEEWCGVKLVGINS